MDGISTALTGLILHTTTLKQAFSQMAQAIIGDLVKMAVEYVVQQGVMFLARKLFGQADQEASNAMAQAAESAWTPAAIAASIASYGVAAAVGQATATAAIESGRMMGSFAVGGYTGDGGAHEVAGVVHRGEYVIDKGTLHRAGGPATFDAMRMKLSSTNANRATAGMGPAQSNSAGGYGGGARKERPVHVDVHNVVVRDDHELSQYLGSAKGQRQHIRITRANRAKIGIRV